MSPTRLRGPSVQFRINGGDPVGGEISVETEVIHIESISGDTKPDLAWTFVDAAGHFHAFSHDGQLPTLVVRRRKRKPTVHRCLACNKKVAPKWTTSYGPKAIPGRQEWTLTVFGDVPAGLFSVRFDSGHGKEMFGFAEMHDQHVEGGLGPELVTSVCHGHVVSWRPTGGAS